jgi:hypothetical protein
MLGTAQLTAAGKATITVRLAVGSHSLQAVFLGSKAYAQSQSSASSLSVAGKYPSSTTLASTPESTTGVYDLTATVFGFGPANAVSPTGTVSFQDSTNSDSQLATAALSSGTSTQALNLLPVGSATLTNASASAVGDFNGDGIPDAAVSDKVGNRVGVLLGNGDGTFGTPAYFPVGKSPVSVLSGDVNNDGNVDLIVTNNGDNTLSILLGKGDGTFQSQQTVSTGIGPQSATLTDLNGDGNLDLVAVNLDPAGVENGLFVYLGNGDGSFQSGTFYQVTVDPGGDLGLVAAVAGDFNGDGALDLAVATAGGYSALFNVAIFLGNGDGTLQSAQLYSINQSGGQPSSAIASGDFNNDGKLDLAIANVSNGFTAPDQSSVTVMLGNGDGTFQQQVYYALPCGSGPSSIQIADFDGDSKLDLAVPMSNYGAAPRHAAVDSALQSEYSSETAMEHSSPKWVTIRCRPTSFGALMDWLPPT